MIFHKSILNGWRACFANCHKFVGWNLRTPSFLFLMFPCFRVFLFIHLFIYFVCLFFSSNFCPNKMKIESTQRKQKIQKLTWNISIFLMQTHLWLMWNLCSRSVCVQSLFALILAIQIPQHNNNFQLLFVIIHANRWVLKRYLYCMLCCAVKWMVRCPILFDSCRFYFSSSCVCVCVCAFWDESIAIL